MSDNVFGQGEEFNPYKYMTDINQGDDSMTPNIAADDRLNGKAVSNCERQRPDGSDRYEEERRLALAAAKADPTLIPVRYSVSAGSAEDAIALWSHERSILRKNSNGVTPFYVGAAKKEAADDACRWSTNCTKNATKTNHFHYLADHQQARQDFIAGERCFFSTVRAIASVDQSGNMTVFGAQAAAPADILAVQNHSLRNLYYGESYDNTLDSGSPRLFKKLGDGTPNIVSIYVADLREKLVDQAGKSVTLLTPEFIKLSKGLTRGDEVTLTFKEIFSLRTIWTERDFVTQILSSQRSSKSGAIAAYEGVPQLIQWLVHSGAEGTVMSTKYTPLVLDLGVKNVRTSSLEAGSFFNMANLQAPVTHMTAWLGGNLIVRDSKNNVNKAHFSREIDDGFLVIPNADGSITSSANLFGSQMKVTVKGEEKTFANGFDTLAALAQKDCLSEDPKKHYLGPWDGELYSKKIKVWVDQNRNAVADTGEILTLQEAKVAAINACHVVYANEMDQFGNSTELRSPFLMLQADESEVAEEELLTRLATGKDKDGQNVEFRLMVDIFFKAKPDVILENIDLRGLSPTGGAHLAKFVR